MWRRLHCIPFEVAFQKPTTGQTAHNQPQADTSLEATLKAELAGIVAWAVQGCLKWQLHGLCPPQIVQDATEAYRVEQDVTEQFIDECCMINSNCTVFASDLWQAFKTWAGDNGEHVGTQTAFGKRIVAKGFSRGKSSRSYYRGLGLLTLGTQASVAD